MIPSQVMVNYMNALLAGDLVRWGSTLPNVEVRLSKSDFVPSAALSLADVTEATFDGYGSPAMLIPFGAQNVILDSDTGRVGILMKEPTGGIKWIVTGTTELPQTIYGWYLYDITADALVWSELLPTPIPLTAVGNVIELTAILGYLVINPYDSEL